MNVCGLQARLQNPEFEELIKQYDILCFQESKLDDLDNEPVKEIFKKLGYATHIKNRFKLSNRKSGGLVICIKFCLQNHVRFKETDSKVVIWVSVMKKCLNIDKHLLLGCVYLPPEGSRYASDDCFTLLEDDISRLNEADDHYVMLVGDFNARTGHKLDFVPTDETIIDGLEDETNIPVVLHDVIELFSDPEERVSSDNKCNNYGNRLLDFCQMNMLYIFNGRMGKDKGIGLPTSRSNSVVDYAIGSPQLIAAATEFEVMVFDRLFSDIHTPIHVVLKDGLYNSQAPSRGPVSNAMCGENHSFRIIWDDEKKDDFVNNLNLESIASVNSLINDDCDVDEICDKIGVVLTTAAKQTFRSRCVTCPRKPPRNVKPWFTAQCAELRTQYRRVKGRLKLDRTNTALQVEMANANKAYKRVLRKAQINSRRDCVNKIRELKQSNPKLYWKTLNSSNHKKNSCNVPLNELYEHFKDINSADQLGNDGAIDVDQVFTNNQNETLNRPITEAEIIKVFKRLKLGKAVGLDGISNEYIKCTSHIMVPAYAKLFNAILNTGNFPYEWSVGKIIPIYKNKGSPEDPNNYRGITILSCLGKVFTGILNDRLSEAVHILDNQAGFRKNCSTTDQVFILRQLIDLYLGKKLKLYCAFVDFQKAFDTVWRHGLWSKLVKHGVEGKIFRTIYSMYENIKSCVNSEGKNSAFFASNIGVRQGENLSPLLFAIYINDMEQSLLQDGCTHLQFGNDEYLCRMLKLFILLYADDTVVIADTPAKLQVALNSLDAYCDMWKLKVNVDKTKIVIFSKRKTKLQPVFTYQGNAIEILSEFKYLGVVFSSTGKFTSHQKHACEQATRAMYSVIRKGRCLHLPIDVMFNLFDTLITPILLYSCEVWGPNIVELIERVHLKFCKHILRLKTSTPSYMVYGETGRFPLSVSVKIRMLSYWGKLVTEQCSKLASVVYNVFIDGYRNNSLYSPWISSIEELLNDTGFSNVFRTHEFPSVDWLIRAVKLRLQDQYIQQWNSLVQTSPKSISYRLYKVNWGMEQYLLKLPSILRICMCKFRTSNHRLAIEKLRYTNVPREQRTCNLCNSNQLGDEFHFLFTCTRLSNERSKYIPVYYTTRPNVIKFEQLINNESKTVQLKLAKFIKAGLKY